MSKLRVTGPFFLTLAGCVVLLAPYLQALDAFFALDDWVWLYFYGSVPLTDVGRFLSPEVIWFYRPLQAWQFGLLHHLFGLDPVPYNLALLGMHLLVGMLCFLFLRELTGRAGLASGATLLFAVSWIYLDVPIWKSNYNTLQNAILTVAACWAFVRHLRTGCLGWKVATLALVVLNFLTKETAVNLPLLLLLVWAYLRFSPRALRPRRGERSVRDLGREAVRLLWPAVVLCILYVVAHRIWVRDIYPESPIHYGFVGPAQGIRQTLFGYNHALLSFYSDPLLLPRLPELHRIVQESIRWLLFIPVLIAVYAWRVRDREILFGLGWFLITYIPTNFLEIAHSSRFYYIPALGAGLVHAALFSRMYRAVDGKEGLLGSLGRVGVAAALAYLVFSNIAATMFLVKQDQQQSAPARYVFQVIQQQRGLLEKGSLLVLRNAPEQYLGNGLGVPEMARIALADPTAEAVIDGQPLRPSRQQRLQQIPNVYILDLATEDPRPVRATPR